MSELTFKTAVEVDIQEDYMRHHFKVSQDTAINIEGPNDITIEYVVEFEVRSYGIKSMYVRITNVEKFRVVVDVGLDQCDMEISVDPDKAETTWSTGDQEFGPGCFPTSAILDEVGVLHVEFQGVSA